MVNALRNKDVKGALVDMFSVATRKDIFRAEDLVAIKSIQHRAAYGFVLSGGLLSRREGIKDYVSNNKGAISKAIEESTPTLSVSNQLVRIFTFNAFLLMLLMLICFSELYMSDNDTPWQSNNRRLPDKIQRHNQNEQM